MIFSLFPQVVSVWSSLCLSQSEQSLSDYSWAHQKGETASFILVLNHREWNHIWAFSSPNPTVTYPLSRTSENNFKCWIHSMASLNTEIYNYIGQNYYLFRFLAPRCWQPSVDIMAFHLHQSMMAVTISAKLPREYSYHWKSLRRCPPLWAAGALLAILISAQTRLLRSKLKNLQTCRKSCGW